MSTLTLSPPTPVAGAIIGLLAIELLSYQNHVRLRRFDIEDQPPEYVGYLREHLGDGILNAGRTGIYAEWGTALAIPQIEALNLMQQERYREFYRRYVIDTGDWQFLASRGDVPFRANAAAIDLLSVRYIVVDSTMRRYERGVQRTYPLVFDDRKARVRVYENSDAFPRAYLSPALSQERLRRGSPEELRGRASTVWPMAQTTSDDPDLLRAARSAGVPRDASSVPRNAGTARVTRSGNTEVEWRWIQRERRSSC